MTSIEWTELTWNPITGCTKISPGCANCYAERNAKRMRTSVPQYRNVVNSQGWTGKIELVESKLLEPLHRQQPTMYFVNSMSDLFHKGVPIEFIKEVFKVMNKTPRHTYQILTKRSKRLKEIAPQLDWSANIWMGVSVENQNTVHRVNYLREVPCAVRFLSCEPLLGSLQLDLQDIHWVIAGGESGPGFREMNLDWAREIRDQCVYSGVAFFFKQVGGRTSKTGGRLLDDRTWSEMPSVQNSFQRQKNLGGIPP